MVAQHETKTPVFSLKKAEGRRQRAFMFRTLREAGATDGDSNPT